MDHRRGAVVPDGPSVVDQAKGKVGLLHRVVEVSGIAPDTLERGAADDGGTTEEGGCRPTAIGTSGADARDMTACSAAVFVDDPEGDDAEVRVGRQGASTEASQRPRSGKPGVVIEEGDDRRTRCGGTEVPPTGDAEVLAGDHYVNAFVSRYAEFSGRPVGDDHDLDRDAVLAERALSTAARNCAGRLPIVKMTTLTSGERFPVTP